MDVVGGRGASPGAARRATRSSRRPAHPSASALAASHRGTATAAPPPRRTSSRRRSPGASSAKGRRRRVLCCPSALRRGRAPPPPVRLRAAPRDPVRRLSSSRAQPAEPGGDGGPRRGLRESARPELEHGAREARRGVSPRRPFGFPPPLRPAPPCRAPSANRYASVSADHLLTSSGERVPELVGLPEASGAARGRLRVKAAGKDGDRELAVAAAWFFSLSRQGAGPWRGR